jgi:hypothetical protein
VAAPSLPAFDAAGYDGGTWVWLDYLHGRLRHGETWMVRYGVMDNLNNRVVPLLGSAGHSVRAELSDGVIDQLNKAAPTSGDVDELRRSLLATAELYDWARGRWAQRTGQPNPQHSCRGDLGLARAAELAAAALDSPRHAEADGRRALQQAPLTMPRSRSTAPCSRLVSVQSRLVAVADRCCLRQGRSRRWLRWRWRGRTR